MTDRSSCRQFNGPGDISDLANKTEAVYRREWPKAIDPRMTLEEKRAMNSLLTRAIKEPTSHIFREPVDPVKLNIPGYFDVYVRFPLCRVKADKSGFQLKMLEICLLSRPTLKKGGIRRINRWMMISHSCWIMLECLMEKGRLPI
jgi:hypothetical protein